MKKEYRKPEIMFEDFSLDTNIAGTCEIITATMGQGACGYYVDALGTTVFTSTVGGCAYSEQTDTDGNYNGICYHVPIESQNLFGS